MDSQHDHDQLIMGMDAEILRNEQASFEIDLRNLDEDIKRMNECLKNPVAPMLVEPDQLLLEQLEARKKELLRWNREQEDWKINTECSSWRWFWRLIDRFWGPRRLQQHERQQKAAENLHQREIKELNERNIKALDHLNRFIDDKLSRGKANAATHSD